jgi:hypothetical protein
MPFQRSTQWTKQANWYIDPSSGDDKYDGGSSWPIRTFEELQRRWGERPLITQQMTINLLGDADEDVVLSAVVDMKAGGRIDLIGQTSNVVTGATIATAQALDYATGSNGQDARITSGGISDFSLHAYDSTGRRIFRPADSSYGFVVDTVGTVATARVTRMAYQSFAPGPGTITHVDLAASDVIDIQQCPRIHTLTLDVQGLDVDFAGGEVPFLMNGVWVNEGGAASGRVNVKGADGLVSNSHAPLFLFCPLQGRILGNGSAILANCGLPGSIQGLTSVAIYGGGGLGLQLQGCHANIINKLCSYGGVGVQVIDGTSVYAKAGEIGSFDGSTGLVVDVHSSIVMDELFGSGNSGFGTQIFGRAYYQSANTPKATGTSGDNNVGGTTIANGSLPSFNSNNGSAFVVEPT